MAVSGKHWPASLDELADDIAAARIDPYRGGRPIIDRWRLHPDGDLPIWPPDGGFRGG